MSPKQGVTLFAGVLALMAVVALVGVLSSGRGPAQAAFHCMRIHAVSAGANGDGTVQYVELRQAIGGQTSVAGTQLKFFPADGMSSTTFTLGSLATPVNGAVGGSILIGTSGVATTYGVTPDFIMPANVMTPGGKVQFTGAFDCAFQDAVIDSVAYGPYMGAMEYPTAAEAGTGLPTMGTSALTLNNLNTQPVNNCMEYSLLPAAPRNNAGVSTPTPTPVGTPTPSCPATPTPTPTATATATPTPTGSGGPTPTGDSDGDGVMDGADNCPNWPNPGQATPIWMVPGGDSDCDGFSSVNENTIGTYPLQQCPTSSFPGDEDPDSWPVDFDDNRDVDITDVLSLKPVFGASVPPALPRFNISVDAMIDISDVLALKPFYAASCS